MYLREYCLSPVLIYFLGELINSMLPIGKRLTCPVSEETKIKILSRNIAPFYQTQLALVEVTSMSQLRELGRRLETRKEAAENFSAPCRKSSALEPDLAHVEVKTSLSIVVRFRLVASRVRRRKLFVLDVTSLDIEQLVALRLIDHVLGHDLEPHLFFYLDDVIIVSQTFEHHLSILEEVFRRLRVADIKVSIDKCQFCHPELKYLGYVVDRNGLHVDPDKVKAMLELPTPTTVSEVCRIVGTFSWYRRFVPDFSSIVAPITGLLKKNSKFIWTEECAVSFRRIKECLVAAPILSCPDYTKPFVVQTDASGCGNRAVLTQSYPEGDKVISYISRSLTKQERNFTTTERECLAVL
ncbi:hypothetical protein JTB14_008120 [Gonioctena quinquepunctata]|nr:hypothetical protein JTB14_008120 [Gonioctena quinquepunctata]